MVIYRQLKSTNTHEKRRTEMAYTFENARNEAVELFNEGYSLFEIRVFLNDLSRSKDISWEDNQKIFIEIADFVYNW